ncbi:mitochondrial carrier domain-containing protein [Schizothecium vesticola]|uniref:Mitochondrial carrier domain-containing protein n=1 Tax=Schizothecium vesticola TaxID=314040 RepID=A0AA40F3Q8_9PEZI|nr:mitochondrial carrier domain-containing protein [Schizothecium vesticola]
MTPPSNGAASSPRRGGDPLPVMATASASIPPNVGILPVIPDGTQPPSFPEKPPTSNAATGASAASIRALTQQAVAFYFRAPVKAFFRTRVDYLAYARALQEQRHALLFPPTGTTLSSPLPSSSTWLNWLKSRARATTPGVIASAISHYGWRVVPDQVLPPLIANVGVGVVLYTSYLHILGRLHPESALASKRVYPPPSPVETFTAGLLAGGIQSVLAAPLDAVQARYDLAANTAAGMSASGNPARTGPAPHQRPQSMWSFGASKLHEIGVRGIFAGWGLSLVKDSVGSAVFFSTFEYLKAQGYYRFVTWYYGALSEDVVVLLSRRRPTAEKERGMPTIIRPHYAIEPAFLLLAGMGASVAQQAVLHPLSHIQSEHWERLEGLDRKADEFRGARGTGAYVGRRGRMMRAYYRAYQKTWAECVAEAEAAGLGHSMRRWLYRGFWWNTIRQVPSTSAGLIIFELVRRKYGMGGEPVRINRDGYDILLG